MPASSARTATPGRVVRQCTAVHLIASCFRKEVNEALWRTEVRDKPKVHKRNEFRGHRVERNGVLQVFAAIIEAASAEVVFTVVTL